MKITFGGKYSIPEFGDAIDRALQTLTLNGADGVSFATLYLHTMQGNRTIRLRQADDERKIVDHLEYDTLDETLRTVHFRIQPADKAKVGER